MESAIAWYGGKGQLARHIVPLFPDHLAYVEPFGGGASCLCFKRPSPLEVYNDADGALVEFWRILRDPITFERFRDTVALIPHSRQEFETAKATWEGEDDPILRAAKWFVMVRQSFSGDQDGGWSYSRTESSSGMSRCTAKWLNSVERLPAVHVRFRRVQVEHGDFREIFARYDAPTTLFYIDPPYVLETRGKTGRYRHELTLDDHRDLVTMLLGLTGKCILSGYQHPVYDRLTEEAGWQRLDFAVQAFAAGRTRKTGILGEGAGKAKAGRTECLWINPQAQARQVQLRLL